MNNELGEQQRPVFLECDIELPLQKPVILKGEIKLPVQEPTIIKVTDCFSEVEFENFCLACGAGIPMDKSFCDNDICENNFYDESDFGRAERDAEEEEDEELHRDERKMKAGIF